MAAACFEYQRASLFHYPQRATLAPPLVVQHLWAKSPQHSFGLAIHVKSRGARRTYTQNAQRGREILITGSNGEIIAGTEIFGVCKEGPGHNKRLRYGLFGWSFG